MPRMESTAKMGKTMSFSQSFPSVSTHPTEWGAQPTRYASVRDLEKVRANAGKPRPWSTNPWMTPQPSLTMRMDGAQWARPATPSSAVGLNLVPHIPPNYATTRPASTRRMYEVPNGYSGLPAYDGSAGRATSLLMHQRIVAAGNNTRLTPQSLSRPGRIFRDDCGVY